MIPPRTETSETIHTPYGDLLLPCVTETPSGHDENTPWIMREAHAMHTAIIRRLALHDDLIAMLDAPLDTGDVAPWSSLSPYMPSATDPGIPEICKKWDGIVDGHELSMPEECIWTTLRDWYGWGIPCAETVTALRDELNLSSLLEFGQGTGYTARILEKSGISMTTAECFNRGYDGVGIWRRPDYNDAVQMLRDHPTTPVLISWPDPQAENLTIKIMNPGQMLIITGSRRNCGLQDDTLVKHGFTPGNHEPIKNAIGSMSGSLSDISVWIAP